MSRVAAIDCGTNSIRLLIADISDGNFREVYRTMEIVRLGEGVDKNKYFNPAAIERTLAAVSTSPTKQKLNLITKQPPSQYTNYLHFHKKYHQKKSNKSNLAQTNY